MFLCSSPSQDPHSLSDLDVDLEHIDGLFAKDAENFALRVF